MTNAERMSRRWAVVNSFVGVDRKITREIMDRAKAEITRRGLDDDTGEGAE